MLNMFEQVSIFQNDNKTAEIKLNHTWKNKKGLSELWNIAFEDAPANIIV